MNRPVRARSFEKIEGLLSKVECERLLIAFRGLPKEFWIRRTTMDPARALPGATCDYYFTSNYRMPTEMVTDLVSLAPVLDGFQLDQVCINRYEPGQFIGPHIDKGKPRNVVISLADDKEQGCLIGDVLHHDVAGDAVIHPGLSLPHSVPMVLRERFVLIFLYDFSGALKCIHSPLTSSGSSESSP